MRLRTRGGLANEKMTAATNTGMAAFRLPIGDRELPAIVRGNRAAAIHGHAIDAIWACKFGDWCGAFDPKVRCPACDACNSLDLARPNHWELHQAPFKWPLNRVLCYSSFFKKLAAARSAFRWVVSIMIRPGFGRSAASFAKIRSNTPSPLQRTNRL